MSNLDVTVLCTDGDSCRATKTFIVVVTWTVESKKNLAVRKTVESEQLCLNRKASLNNHVMITTCTCITINISYIKKFVMPT